VKAMVCTVYTTTVTTTFQPQQQQAATELVSKWISRKVSIYYCWTLLRHIFVCLFYF